jgi:hypothetical protein
MFDKLVNVRPYWYGFIAILFVGAVSAFYQVNLVDVMLLIVVLVSIYFICDNREKYAME